MRSVNISKLRQEREESGGTGSTECEEERCVDERWPVA